MSHSNRKCQRNQQAKIQDISKSSNVKPGKQFGHEGSETRRYMPGLDGLRALAVFAVIAYHLNLAWAPGGLLGVCLFFVLSGYLITDILINQWSLSGRMDLKGFWLRRARRLLPALFVMLTGVIIWISILSPSRLESLWKDILAAVTYSSNWWLIFHHVSYFASFGPPSPLGHLWSLAVEEQFYLVWPLLLWLGLRYVPHRRRLIGITIALALTSAMAMALIYQPGTDPSRVYYGTDTRAFALLTGAALALVWPSHKLSDRLSPKRRFALDIAGAAGLLIVLMMIWKTNEYEIFLYKGGLLLFSLASAIIVAVLAHPSSRLAGLLGRQPLRWLGTCSYGIYLWHYPVIILTNPAVNTGGPDLGLAAGQIAASISLAGLSWYFIEEPIRHGNWKRLWGQLHHSKIWHKLVPVNGKVRLSSILLVLSASCLAILGGCALISHTKHATPLYQNNGGSKAVIITAQEQAASESKTIAEPSNDDKDVNQRMQPGAFDEDETKNPVKEGENSGSAVRTNSGRGVTVIGDSVMAGVEPELKKLLPGIVIDAQVGRQMYQAQSVITKLKSQGSLGKKIVIELGTNGSFTEEQLTNLLDSLGQMQQIVLVNTRVPRPWEDVVNKTLAQVSDAYPNITLVNWYSASSKHNDYFYPDGVHLNQKGIQAYASLVAEAIH